MFAAISPEEVHRHLKDGTATLADLRDAESRAAGAIPSSIHLTDRNLPNFIVAADKDQPLIVYCYHGNMSHSTARMLAGQGFRQVYSMTGGFAAWSTQFPALCTVPPDATATD